jgi:hypothetical protein
MLGPLSIDVRLTTDRKLTVEANDNGLLAPALSAGIARIKGVRDQGVRTGNWLRVAFHAGRQAPLFACR